MFRATADLTALNGLSDDYYLKYNIAMEHMRTRKLVIAIPSSSRLLGYSKATIASLVDNMAQDLRKSVIILILNADYPPE